MGGLSEGGSLRPLPRSPAHSWWSLRPLQGHPGTFSSFAQTPAFLPLQASGSHNKDLRSEPGNLTPQCTCPSPGSPQGAEHRSSGQGLLGYSVPHGTHISGPGPPFTPSKSVVAPGLLATSFFGGARGWGLPLGAHPGGFRLPPLLSPEPNPRWETGAGTCHRSARLLGGLSTSVHAASLKGVGAPDFSTAVLDSSQPKARLAQER